MKAKKSAYTSEFSALFFSLGRLADLGKSEVRLRSKKVLALCKAQ